MLNSIYNRLTIYCQSLLPGLGKTFMTLNEVIPKYFSNEINTFVYSAPTIKLLEQTKKDIINFGVDEEKIVIIHSEQDESIIDQIKKIDINNKSIVLITHVSYLNFYKNFNDFDIKIFDEEIESLFKIHNPFFNTPSEKGLMKEFLDFETIEEYPNLKRIIYNKNGYKPKSRSVSYRSMYYHFYQYLNNDTFDLFVIDSILQDYLSGKRNDLIYFSLAKTKVLESKKHTYYLGYDIKNGFTSLIMDALYNIDLIENKNTNIRKEYDNHITINYLYKDIVTNNDIKKEYNNQEGIIREYIQYNNLLRDSLYIWQYKTTNEFENYLKENNSLPIPAKPHGMNDSVWMTYDKVAVIANYLPTPIECELGKALHIDIDKIVEARHINMIIQAMARCIIRKNNIAPIELTVIDERTAKLLQKRFKNCFINHIGLEIIISKNKRNTNNNSINKSNKEKLRSKINYLKNKNKLTEKQKLKLSLLTEQYNALRVYNK